MEKSQTSNLRAEWSLLSQRAEDMRWQTPLAYHPQREMSPVANTLLHDTLGDINGHDEHRILMSSITQLIDGSIEVLLIAALQERCML